MKCYVQLSKFGDILSIAPILFAEFQKTGERQVLVVAREYASILDGFSYIKPLVYEGAADDLRGAVKFAKQSFSQVMVLQTHGNMPVQQTCPSFQHDQWKRAGYIDQFDLLPLVIDGRSKLRERILFRKHIREHKGTSNYYEKYIVFADHSQSSPFLYKEDLARMLHDQFGSKYQIVRLSELRAERIYDLVGLFERAQCIITVETAHLHLARAVGVPTIVLATDRWRGSAFRSGFRFYCRYAEWERRKTRLMFEVESALRGISGPELKPYRTKFPNGYNMSQIVWNGEMIRCYRYHPEPTWKTKLAIDDSRFTHPIQMPNHLDGFSIEDPRLFIFKNQLHVAYTVASARANHFISVMAYGRLINGPSGWQIIDHAQPQYAGNDFSGLQKNWCPLVIEGRLHFVYGNKGGEQIVLAMDGDRVATVHKSPSPRWDWGEIRGGVVVENAGKLYRFFHSRQDYQDKTIRYFVGCSIIDPRPPFKTLSVSASPILEGNEFYVPNCRQWKANVVIPYGCIFDSGKFSLSVGVNDSRCCTVDLTEKELKL